MLVELKIYADNSSETPSKVYQLRRINMKTQIAMEELEKTDLTKLTPKEQIRVNLDFIKTLFPDFTDEDFELLDLNDWQNFCLELGKEINKSQSKALKN